MIKRRHGLLQIGTATLLLTIITPHAFSQELPVGDGAYLSKEHCEMAERGELDMVSFQIENDGRSVGMYESACLVANITPIRERRYHVEMDCREIVDIYQYQFFLDVVSDDHIRVEGEDLWICKKGFLATEPIDSENSISDDDLKELWFEAHEGCAGGSGDNPETYKACDRRTDYVEHLAERGWCYGREDQVRSDYDWHKCGPKSLR